jgi:hypothetical protein
MVKLENEIIAVTELEVIERSHEHDFGDGELLQPTLVSFYPQQISFSLFPLFFFGRVTEALPKHFDVIFRVAFPKVDLGLDLLHLGLDLWVAAVGYVLVGLHLD